MHIRYKVGIEKLDSFQVIFHDTYELMLMTFFLLVYHSPSGLLLKLTPDAYYDSTDILI